MPGFFDRDTSIQYQTGDLVEVLDYGTGHRTLGVVWSEEIIEDGDRFYEVLCDETLVKCFIDQLRRKEIA